MVLVDCVIAMTDGARIRARERLGSGPKPCHTTDSKTAKNGHPNHAAIEPLNQMAAHTPTGNPAGSASVSPDIRRNLLRAGPNGTARGYWNAP
jgi:hypothetical protein